MISVEGVSKRYGQHLAVDDISFRVDAGEVVGFLGPNGAGKSTTMNIITGYLSATAGRVTVDGFDVLEDPDQVKRRVGYLPELPPLYLDMTVREYLRFVARLKKAERSTAAQQQERILELAGIAHVRDRLIKNLSKGYRQRVGLAQALVGSPRVLILDEPTIGLDPHQIIEIRNLIRELGHEHTIILSSHILPEVSAVCDRVIIINRGKLVASDTTENLGKRLHDSSEFRLRVAGSEEAALAALAGVAGVDEVSAQGTVEQGHGRPARENGRRGRSAARHLPRAERGGPADLPDDGDGLHARGDLSAAHHRGRRRRNRGGAAGGSGARAGRHRRE